MELKNKLKTMKRIIFIFILILIAFFAKAQSVSDLVGIHGSSIEGTTGAYVLSILGTNVDGDTITIKKSSQLFADSASAEAYFGRVFRRNVFEKLYSDVEADMYRAFRVLHPDNERATNQKLINTIQLYTSTISGAVAGDFLDIATRRGTDFNGLWFTSDVDSTNQFFVVQDQSNLTEADWTNGTIVAALDSIAVNVTNLGLTPKVGGVSGKMRTVYENQFMLTGPAIPTDAAFIRYFRESNEAATGFTVLNNAVADRELKLKSWFSLTNGKRFYQIYKPN